MKYSKKFSMILENKISEKNWMILDYESQILVLMDQKKMISF